MKDYYRILNIPETASREEIKKAFRKLALQFHPDKNHPDPYADAYFREIKEAYEILMHPYKREAYLEQRRAAKAQGFHFQETITGPATLLVQCLEMSKQIAFMDVHRMDFKGLASRLTQLLCNDNIEQLHNFREPEINSSILSIVLKTIGPFPLTACKEVCAQLERLAANEPEMLKQIRQFKDRKRKQEQWERYRIGLALLTVVLLCILIYFAGKR